MEVFILQTRVYYPDGSSILPLQTNEYITQMEVLTLQTRDSIITNTSILPRWKY